MKLSIRRKIFETNSSSVHAIAISNEVPNTLPSFVYFGRGEYGWEWERYDYDEDKANYLYECLIDLYYDWINNDDTKLTEVCDQIKEDLASYGIGCRFERVDRENIFAGYVDHGGENRELVEYLLSDPENLIRFLFNDDSYILTGNDNSYYKNDYEDDYEDDYFNMPDNYNGIQFMKYN